MQLSLVIHQNLIWVLLISPVLFSPFSMASRSSVIRLECSSDNSTINKTLISDAAKLLDSIQKQLTSRKWGYGSVTSSLHKVYALAECHVDLSDQDCKLCYMEGRVKLPACLPSTSARVYLDGCFVRYDNYSFFHEYMDPKYDSVRCSKPTGVLADKFQDMEFKNKVAEVIVNVTARALVNGSFAVVESEGGIFPVYALAQCWGMLNKEKCRRCLVKAGSKLRRCSPGADNNALFTGCYMRYSTQKFFNNTEEPTSNRGSNKKANVVAIAFSAVGFIVLTSFGTYIGYERRLKRNEALDQNNLEGFPAGSTVIFNYEVLEKATNSFDDSRKLGQGGDGSVFKGILPDGRIVAVKRLVYNSRQWVDQLFNEVNLVSGIKHNNLVTLWGCSINGPESLLVYEYAPLRSLDQFIFVKDTIHILSWQQRFNIIRGTAEGLAYLHGGPTPIIHRDIKSSNVLLDAKFIPKISDFGLALSVATDESHTNCGIAGTLGYMAPEYLVKGRLTEKADVYSFGVLVLEIACGKKNSVYSQGSGSILHVVWKHHKANTITNSIDPRLNGRFCEKDAADVLRIGLLCTQTSAALRPSMAEIVQMLTNREFKVPSPKQPPFLNASVLSISDCTESSITKVSLTSSSVVNQGKIAQVPLRENGNSWISGSHEYCSISEQPKQRKFLQNTLKLSSLCIQEMQIKESASSAGT